MTLLFVPMSRNFTVCPTRTWIVSVAGYALPSMVK
jgi:hypothetical protein